MTFRLCIRKSVRLAFAVCCWAASASLAIGLLCGGSGQLLPRAAAKLASPGLAIGQDRPPRGAELGELKPGEAGEHALTNEEVHTRRITLAAGQFLSVEAKQLGINIILSLYGPDEKLLLELNCVNDTQGLEDLYWIAHESGAYRLTVGSRGREAISGRYRLRVAELRGVRPGDEKLLAAQQLFVEGQYLRAQGKAEPLRKAIEKYQAAMAAWRAMERRDKEAELLLALGLCHSLLGEKQKAVEYYLQSLPLHRALGDSFGEGKTLNNIGSIYIEQGQRQQALEYLQQALPLRRTAKDDAGEATTLLNIGGVYNELGKKSQALGYFQQSLAIARRIGNRGLEANLLVNFAAVYSAMGDTQKALDFYQEVLPVLQLLKDYRREAIVLTNLGSNYSVLGEAQRALNHRQRALTIARDVGDQLLEANVLYGIGQTLLDQDNPQESFSYFEQAQALFRKLSSRSGEATTLLSVGFARARMGELQRALEQYQEVLPVFHEIGDPQREANTLNLIGRIYAEQREPEKALDYFQRALRLWQAAGFRKGEMMALFHTAQSERLRGNWVAARAAIESAIHLTESVRASVESVQLRTSFFTNVQSYFELYVDLLMERRSQQPELTAAALQVNEQSRARGLLDSLMEMQLRIRQGAPPQLLERERDLQQQVNDKATRLSPLKANPRLAAQAAALEKEMDALLAELQNVKTELRRQSPRYAALTQPQPVSVKEIQTELLDADTMLLQYALGSERSYLWAVTRDSVTAYQLPPRAEIEAAARQAHRELSSPPPDVSAQRDILRGGTSARASDAIARLSDLALRPVAAQLKKKRLVIVADGALQFIPFGVLSAKPAGKGIHRPLILDHEVVGLPSASTLAMLRRNPVNRDALTKTVALFADPVFDARDERINSAATAVRQSVPASRELMRSLLSERLAERGAAQSRQDAQLEFPRLRFTRQEASRIAALAPANEKMIALDFKANREAVLGQSLKQYRFVHFATHAYLDSERPELSALVLAQVDETGAPVEGFLRAHEIYNLDLPVDLVVLSACRTGLGKQIKGEGLVGVTQGFLYAGASRVVVSLWSVNDAATAELMERFYRNMLKQKMTPASALRAAQIEMLRRPNRQAPYYWAAFLPLGDWR